MYADGLLKFVSKGPEKVWIIILTISKSLILSLRYQGFFVWDYGDKNWSRTDVRTYTYNLFLAHNDLVKCNDAVMTGSSIAFL